MNRVPTKGIMRKDALTRLAHSMGSYPAGSRTGRREPVTQRVK
jgi:hypothetical protein